MRIFKEVLSKAELRMVEERPDFGRFVFEPLPVGFGHTLGSSLRRVLLSSIAGAAATQVKIEGVSHQFSTVPGVREDVLEILLNVKKIRLKIFNDQPVILKIEKSGLGQVKVSGLEVLGEGEVLSPDLVLATLTDKKAKLSLEITCESGVGFEAAEEHPGGKIGVLPVDSVFTPVVNVSYRVATARLGQVTSLDSLEISVKTDGTISPKDSLQEAAARLRDFFAAFGRKPAESEAHEDEEGSASGVRSEDLNPEEVNLIVEDLGLSTRATNALLRSKIKTLGELYVKRHELTKVKGLGQKGVAEIGKLLTNKGWK